MAMATWMEIRCDVRAERIGHDGRCFSEVNEGPMAMAGSTHAEVISALKMLANDAIKSGWKRTRDGWACPYCAAADLVQTSSGKIGL